MDNINASDSEEPCGLNVEHKRNTSSSPAKICAQHSRRQHGNHVTRKKLRNFRHSKTKQQRRTSSGPKESIAKKLATTANSTTTTTTATTTASPLFAQIPNYDTYDTYELPANISSVTSSTTSPSAATAAAMATPLSSVMASATSMLATFLVSATTTSTTLSSNNNATAASSSESNAALPSSADFFYGAQMLDESGSGSSSFGNRFIRENAAESNALSIQSAMPNMSLVTAMTAGIAGNLSLHSTNFSIFGNAAGSVSSSGGNEAATTTYGLVTTTTNRDISFNDSDDMLTENATEYIFDRTDVRIVFITLYTLVFCCCFFGNLLVILVVTLSRRLRSITNFFLANLALADFCVGLFCVMQNLSIYLIDSWVFGEFLCRMYQFVHSLSYTASIFILVVICMERYFAIVHPITCKQILTAARLRMVILTVWITSAVYSTPKFVFSKTIKNIHNEDGQEEEICVLDRKMFNSKLLDMINFGLLYVIPLLVMTVLYSKIAIALWRSSRGLSHQIAQQQQHDNNSINMHNSMYGHHHHQQQQQKQHNSHNNQQQQEQQQPPDTPISMASSAAGSALLSRKQSSKYEKRAVSISESQVSLESDRPIVSACRKTSFYNHHQHHHHPHHHHSSANQHNLHSQQTRYASTQRGVAAHISHSSSNVLRARRGVVRMLIIFVLTFALCNLPYHARKMWQYWSRSYRGDSNFNALLTPLTFLVTYFNSGVNPLLYAFLSRNFRKGMKELLLCSWKKGKGKSSSNSSMHHKRIALQTHSLPTDTTHIGNEQV